MEAITQQEAVAYVNAESVEPTTIEQLQRGTDGEFELVAVTQVKTAAKHKEEVIHKVSRSKAILPISGDTYRNMVIESAKALGNEAEVAENFTVSDTFYEHTECYPICKAKKGDTYYLYGIYTESSKPVFIKDGEELTKEQVAEYLTPAEAKKLLGDDKPVVTENKSQGISHSVKPRTTKLENIKSISRV